jgi:hypothetical protein
MYFVILSKISIDMDIKKITICFQSQNNKKNMQSFFLSRFTAGYLLYLNVSDVVVGCEICHLEYIA